MILGFRFVTGRVAGAAGKWESRAVGEISKGVRAIVMSSGLSWNRSEQ